MTGGITTEWSPICQRFCEKLAAFSAQLSGNAENWWIPVWQTWMDKLNDIFCGKQFYWKWKHYGRTPSRWPFGNQLLTELSVDFFHFWKKTIDPCENNRVFRKMIHLTGQNYGSREIIQNVFSPMVAVMSSPQADEMCYRNNLSFVEMLQPFCKLSNDGMFSQLNITVRRFLHRK